MKAVSEEPDGGIERTHRTDPKLDIPFVPSEAWIDAFETQACVPGFEEKLLRFARRRAAMVAHGGRRIDELYARELVQDALEDTLEGVLAWDPDRVTLDKHLFDAIRSRTRHDYVQAQRFPHHAFDAADAPASLSAAVESSLAAQRGGASSEIASAAERAVVEIRQLAASDADVLRLIDAYALGATKKIDVLRVSDLTSKRYEAARKRMQRLVLQLPTAVREVVRA